ncbi:MAG: hypothetical protein ABSE51_08325 [Terracidiphilus sp.]|jgi:hypothetical protein
MKLIWLVAMVASGFTGLAASAAPAPSPWEQPTASMAGQIAEILGPGQARLTIRNISTIPNDEIPEIRRLLEEDLKAHGVLIAGTESANAIRMTLSENQRERLWVAEITEGNETHVAMVQAELGSTRQVQAGSSLILRKQTLLISSDVLLATLETVGGLVAIEPEDVVIYGHTADGWRQQKRVGIGQKKPLERDPRGIVVPSPSGDGFEASVAGMNCSGSYQPAQPTGEWTVRCRESDDPWPIMQGSVSQPEVTNISLKAFYNAARNYFTGIVTPSLDVDLSPFYSAAMLPRVTGIALVINGIDGKIQIAEHGVLKPVAGARDWGSDIAALSTRCGAGTQIVASGSGEAVSDSLRAYELPAQEAVPASAPLTMEGTVTSLWTAPDLKSVFAVVRSPTNQYEVDRVTASCN